MQNLKEIKLESKQVFFEGNCFNNFRKIFGSDFKIYRTRPNHFKILGHGFLTAEMHYNDVCNIINNFQELLFNEKFTMTSKLFLFC